MRLKPQKTAVLTISLTFRPQLILAAIFFLTAPVSAAPKTATPSQPTGTTGVFIDSRDGKKYKTVVMPDGKTWMAENLNYKPSSGKSWCYKNKSSKCAKYGRLYDWNTAMSACPADWRLPSDAEWTALTDAVGGASTASRALKSTKGWKKHENNGTDDYGFSALPGGCRRSGGSFRFAGNNGYWWTATQFNASSAWLWVMYYHFNLVDRYWYDKDVGLSLRCIRDVR